MLVSTLEIATRELPVFRVIRIRNHLDRRNHVDRQIDGLATGGRISRLAEFTSQPACVAWAPFMLIRPSGPRTTPGTRGSRLSIFSSWLGAASTVDWPIVFC